MANVVPPYLAITPMRSSRSSFAAPWLQGAQSTLAQVPPREDKVGLVDLILNKGIAGGTGVLLAVLQAHLRDGLDVHKVPIDLAASVVADIVGYAINSPATVQIGSSCTTVYTFRKSLELLGALETLTKKTAIHGEPVIEVKEAEPETDPVVEAANDL